MVLSYEIEFLTRTLGKSIKPSRFTVATVK